MEIKRQDHSNFVLMQANSADLGDSSVSIAYIELEKEELKNWLELRDKLKDLESNGVSELTLDAGLYWIEDIPHQLEELCEELFDAENIEVTQIPEDFLNANEMRNEMRVEGSDAKISEYGVGFKATLKYSGEVVNTWSLSWDFIEQALKNCDPQSIRFIKDEEDA